MTPDTFRDLALRLPGAIEAEHMGHRDFRVRKRIFATLGYPSVDFATIALTIAWKRKAPKRLVAEFDED
jgi:hypothetical protein